MKAGVRRLRRQASHLQETISTLPQSTKKALGQRHRHGPVDSMLLELPFEDITKFLQEIEESCSALLKIKEIRGKATYVEKTCLALWEIFEESVRRPFIRTWNAVRTPDRKVSERGPREFVQLDALFIQVTLHAIDPEVKFPAIVNGLKRVASQKPRSG